MTYLKTNAITLLVGAQHSFSRVDVSKISMLGANVRNAIIEKVVLR